MDYLRVSEVASILNVSDDTVRRLIDDGKLTASRKGNRIQVDPLSVVERLSAIAAGHSPGRKHSSIRNQLRGLVTKIIQDEVMSQVEMVCGPYRIVSLISTAAARDMGLEVGSIAVANMKATNVSISLDKE
ncbi:MAG: TOBE domain-containing protein [Actinomycetaceae bacterium]|nr:TOBE domain-containing protein [Actinomycetaceae bacterium]